MKNAIAYFSRTNNTKQEAVLLSDLLGVPATEIKAAVPYLDVDINWQNKDCRANQEQDDQSCRPAIEPVTLPDFDNLFLGYPTWWGIPPRLIETFLESQDLRDKTIIPFTTSGSSPAERGGNEIKALLPQATVLPATRVNNFSKEQLNAWLNKLDL